MKINKNALLLSIILVVLWSPFAYAQIQFEEVTQAAGMDYTGKTVGASWGDFNGDGWPDLWVSNHAESPILYLNNTDGTFIDSTNIVSYNLTDMHGAAWADFDNDGDQDLIQVCGAQYGTGSDPNQFFVNSGGFLQNKAVDYGIDYPLGRGYTPLWFDWNGDGYLDILFANLKRPDGQAPTAIFTQQINYFTNDNNLTSFIMDGPNLFAQLFFMDNPLLVVHGFSYPDRIYQYDSLPFLDMTNILGLPTTYGAWDVAIADFDNNLLFDFYITRLDNSSSSVMQTSPTSIRARIDVNVDEKGFLFKSYGNVKIQIDPYWSINNTDIYIGSTGFHPANNPFTLSYLDEAVYGIFDHTPGVDYGIYIGYDPVTNLWHLYFSKDSQMFLNISVYSDAPVSELTTVGFVNSDGTRNDRLLIQTAAGFQDNTSIAGVDVPTSCESVVAADFDNDMDIDIYIVCRSPVHNVPNILYENLGNGTFQAVLGAGGAEGSSAGRGESVVIADYNRDGFMDIFVTNGSGSFPFYNDGPHQLFRNVGNTNHWLEIDLEGVVLNRDGIGTLLLATAGGITQSRYQDNGIHKYSQNHQRIHFGLADNTVVEQLTIQWPSGIVQEIDNIPADQIFQAIELDIACSQTSGTPPHTVDCTSNSQGLYQPLSYEWDFDNNGTIDSTVQNPSYIYNNPGNYTVKLTITDYDGSIYTSTRTDYITVCSPVRIAGTTPVYYSTLQEAYDVAVGGDTIQSQAITFTENLTINRDILVTLEGGYDCDYSTNTGKTILNGMMTISNGTVIIENFVLE